VSARPRRPLLRARTVGGALALTLFAGPATGIDAQSVGRLEGTVVDSLRAASPIAGASVSATRLGSQRETTLVAHTDSRGRFAFDRLDAGEYAIGFEHERVHPWIMLERYAVTAGVSHRVRLPTRMSRGDDAQKLPPSKSPSHFSRRTS